MPEPKKITAGNSYSWTKSFGDYPASDSWELAYSIVSQDNQYPIDGANVVASGDGFEVSVPAALSTTFAPGYYSIIGYVSKGTQRISVYEDRLRVLDNFTSAHDRRSYWQKILDDCRALLSDRSSTDVVTSTIEGDSLTLMTPDQLLVLHDRAERELARLRNLQRSRRLGTTPGTVQVRFN